MNTKKPVHRGVKARRAVHPDRLEHIRPTGFPAFLGFSNENAAHRIAVLWDDPSGGLMEGVFIPRRDTGSLLNRIGGGRVFPGEHRLANIRVSDDGARIDFDIKPRDKTVAFRARGSDTDALPPSPCFALLADSSRFFECGSLGYSVTSDSHRLDGLRLKAHEWRVRALGIE